MSIVEQHRLENSEQTHKSWLRMQTLAAQAIEKTGGEFIVWKNMSVANCIFMENLYSELECYEAAIILRDNLHKCFDFDSSLLSSMINKND